MRRPARRQPLIRSAQQDSISQLATLPAPVRGWVLNENIVVQRPDSAAVLENWFPTSSSVRVRKGARLHATVAEPVVSMFAYVAPSGTRAMFAASASKIWNVTAPVSATVAPTPAITGQTAGYYSTQQITTAGGSFLMAVNGADRAQLYNGTTWVALDADSTPAVTGLATTTLSHVWLHQKRLWFVRKGTLDAAYLPVDSIAGALTTFSLASVFRRGGALLSGSTWSINDSGDGLDDRMVFISTEGEVAVYQGTDPSSASTWALLGVYEVGKPLGLRAFMRAGGDLLMLTAEGVVPLTMAVQRDPAALKLSAISRAIEPYWTAEAATRTAANWEIVKNTSAGWAAVIYPTANPNERGVLPVNLETGAWARWRGWDARCAVEHAGAVYYGDSVGAVFQMDAGGSDNGAPYEARLAMAPSHLGALGSYKHVHMARGTFIARNRFNARISLGRDYLADFPPPPDGESNAGAGFWGLGIWGASQWGILGGRTVTTRWVSLRRNAEVATLQVQINNSSLAPPEIEIASIDVLFDTGGAVV